jgi:hypothetical protein
MAPNSLRSIPSTSFTGLIALTGNQPFFVSKPAAEFPAALFRFE